MTKTSGRVEAAAAYAGWHREAGIPWSLGAADHDERAALLSYELRRELAERLARLGYQGDPGSRASDRGQGPNARSGRAGTPRLARLLRGLLPG